MIPLHPNTRGTEMHEMDRISTTDQLKGQLSGVLPDNKSSRRLQRSEKIRRSLLWSLLPYRLRILFDEICRFPKRIAFYKSQYSPQEGIPVHCPELFSRSDLREQYQQHCIRCIRDLATRTPGWGPIETHVVVLAFYAGATFGGSFADKRIRNTCPQDLTR
jgi:hypothetical protein